MSGCESVVRLVVLVGLLVLELNLLLVRVEAGVPFPLVPYDRRSSSLLWTTPRYSCKRVEVRIRVPVHGCGNVILRTHACRGHCRSLSFPEWTFPDSMRMVRFCNCCKPTTTETIGGMRVNCPGGERVVRLNMKAARECHCRPCSDGQPDFQQPYDYDY